MLKPNLCCRITLLHVFVYTSLRWAVSSFFFYSTIFLFIFAAPWLTGQIVAMECAVGQKERRSRNSVTSWRGLTLPAPLPHFHHSLSSLSLYLKLVFPLRSSLTHSFSLLYFDAGPGTLAWPLFLHSLSLFHTHT